MHGTLVTPLLVVSDRCRVLSICNFANFIQYLQFYVYWLLRMLEDEVNKSLVVIVVFFLGMCTAKKRIKFEVPNTMHKNFPK